MVIYPIRTYEFSGKCFSLSLCYTTPNYFDFAKRHILTPTIPVWKIIQWPYMKNGMSYAVKAYSGWATLYIWVNKKPARCLEILIVWVAWKWNGNKGNCMHFYEKCLHCECQIACQLLKQRRYNGNYLVCRVMSTIHIANEPRKKNDTNSFSTGLLFIDELVHHRDKKCTEFAIWICAKYIVKTIRCSRKHDFNRENHTS